METKFNSLLPLCLCLCMQCIFVFVVYTLSFCANTILHLACEAHLARWDSMKRWRCWCVDCEWENALHSRMHRNVDRLGTWRWWKGAKSFGDLFCQDTRVRIPSIFAMQPCNCIFFINSHCSSLSCWLLFLLLLLNDSPNGFMCVPLYCHFKWKLQFILISWRWWGTMQWWRQWLVEWMAIIAFIIYRLIAN